MRDYDTTHDAELSDMVGLVFDHVFLGSYDRNDAILFKAADGRDFILSHMQNCCESVEIDLITGDLCDLWGVPILEAEENSEENDTSVMPPKNRDSESFTWTTHRFRTANGDVTIRWYGESNGCYDEGVGLIRVDAGAATGFEHAATSC